MIALTILLAMQATAANPDMVCDRDRADAGMTVAMNLCAQADYNAADRALNEAWDLISKAYKRSDATMSARPNSGEDRSSAFAKLLAAQRAWLTYRDAECEVAADRYRGGTMRPMAKYACLERVTRDRTRQLFAVMEPY